MRGQAVPKDVPRCTAVPPGDDLIRRPGQPMGPLIICEDPNCPYPNHGSLRQIVRIMLDILERVRREDPAEYERFRAEVRREMEEEKERATAVGSPTGGAARR